MRASLTPVLVTLLWADIALADDMILAVQTPPTSLSPATQPSVDGTAMPLEYFDGKQFPMTGFGSAVADIAGFIMVSGADDPAWASDCVQSGTTQACDARTLFLGFDIPIVSSTPQSGYVMIFVDGQRSLSLQGITDTPQADDRFIRINYNDADPSSNGLGTININQSRGNGGVWQDVTNTANAVPWRVAAVNQGDERIHVEVSLQLTTEMVVTNKTFGLGITHRSVAGGGLHNLPNEPGVNVGHSTPSSWKTVVLGDYDPIPVEVVTYNIGQMPTITLCPVLPGPCQAAPLPDGGEGEPNHFADLLFDKEIACVQEVWSRGDREELLGEIDLRRSQNNLQSMHVVGAPPDDNPDGDGAGAVSFNNVTLLLCLWVSYGGVYWACENQHVDQYTGLLLLSERGQLEGRVFEFGEESSGQCWGDFEPFFSGDWGNDFDCGQDKGMLWGRILTEASEVTTIEPRTGAEVSSERKDASQFLDVFCTHVDSGPDQEDRDAANADFIQLKAWIDSVRMNDRPAVLMGDMNTDWNPSFAPNPITGPNSAIYDTMMANLGIDALTTFDSLNTTFSDVYDIPALNGSGERVGTDVTKTAGTVLGECSSQTQANLHWAPVLDYVFLLPPPNDGTTFPNFAVKKDPSAAVEAQYRDNLVPTPSECLSDHAMVTANFELAQTYEPGKYNPSRTHTVRHFIKSVFDFEEGNESDSDWFSNDHRVRTGPTAGNWNTNCNNPHSSGSTCDGSNCAMNWSSCTVPIDGTSFAGVFLHLDDEEGPGTYQFDTSPEVISGSHQRSPHFVFDHFLGTWTKASDGWSTIGSASLLDDLNPPPGTTTWTMSYDKAGDGFFGGGETDYRARAVHYLEVQE